MSDPVVQCFRIEFGRFFDLLETRIEACPDGLWNRKAGGYVVWQQFFHSLACTLLFAGTQDVFDSLGYSRQVVMFSEEAETPMTLQEMRALAQRARQEAHAVSDGQSVATTPVHIERLSK